MNDGKVRRVVVTGVGAVTPIGNTAGAFWDALVDGTSGAAPITHFDASALGDRGRSRKNAPQLLRKAFMRGHPFLALLFLCALTANAEQIASRSLVCQASRKSRTSVSVASAVSVIEPPVRDLRSQVCSHSTHQRHRYS